MVSVELVGGLGNQMFQIAACIAYAKRHGLQFHIPLETSNCHSKQPYFNLTNPDWNESLPKTTFQEKNFHYSEIPAFASHGMKSSIPGTPPEHFNLILKGYFQSYKYFEDQKDAIIQAFGFTGQLKDARTIAVHVRRGDYLLYPTKHPVVTERYLVNAVKHCCIHYPNASAQPFFKFFSDDIPWCRDFVSRNFGNPEYYSFSEGKSPKEDMQEMINCHGMIMSNGTFAWWSAYLMQALNNPPAFEPQIIIYPATWFGPDYEGNDTKDMCPADWVKIL